MRRLLREPLVHFLGLGILLFLLYGWAQDGFLDAPEEIVVSRGQVQSLQVQFERTWQRSPTPEELQGLVESWVREEVFYREGLAAGLERDDPIVRRRIGQKIEFMIEFAPQAPPSNAELQSWLEAHADQYAVEPRHSLRQVFFDPARRGGKLDDDIAGALRALKAGKAVNGDPTLLPATLEDAPASDIEAQFGPEFAASLRDVAVGEWHGPLRSPFGLHLIELSASAPPRPATLDEARAAVERDLAASRRDEVKKAYYETLRAKYTVRVESANAETAASE
ncbi:MAG: peptidylprolyl isomerase [Pseudomonadota bacterium]|nr:peptidylprolyl isomerase [Pseudomonadota bacterium]